MLLHPAQTKHATLARLEPDACQPSVRRLSDGCPTSVDACPMPVRCLSDACPTPVRCLSDACPTHALRLSDEGRRAWITRECAAEAAECVRTIRYVLT